MPSAWLMWDRVRALTRANRIYQSERIFQDQSQLDRITAGGEFLDWNQQAAILDQTNLHINRLQRYRDYEQMDQMGEISLALDLYADEASLVDPERKHTLIIRAKSRRIKKELEELFFGTLMWDNQCRSCIRYLCKFGDCPYEVVPTRNRDGVAALRHMNVYNFTRVETKYGDLVGFFFQDEVLPEPLFLHPWQVVHMRLSSLENIFNPYGRSILDGGRKAFKQLRLMEDAALIYRITRAPDKRKFKIPVGIIPPKEVPEYMEMIARKFKRQRFYNPQTGTFDERYSPLIQEDDFFLPVRPDGTGPDVDVLQGAQNLDDIKDIEYFKKKMVAPMKIPFSRVGIGEGAGEASEKSLSATSAEFAKAVQWVQREGASGLTKVAIIHLALRGYSIQDIKSFELALTASSAIEDLYRMETWQTRTQVMSDLKELGWFPKEWIVTHFTDLTPDEIQELKEMERIAADGGDDGGDEGEGAGGLGGGMGGAAPPPGGGDDLGGLGDEEGKPEGDDEKPGGEEEGLGGGGGAGAGGAGGLGGGGLGERFNTRAERRLLVELRRQGNSQAILEILERWAQRLGKQPRDHQHISSFSYLIEHKELDGLTMDRPDPNTNGMVRDPNDDRGLLVEWSVPPEVRDDVIRETRLLLTGGSATAALDDADAVTEADLPV